MTATVRPHSSLRCRPLVEDRDLPLLVEPESADDDGASQLEKLLPVLAESRSWLEEALECHGGVLLRGFEVDGPSDLQRVVQTSVGELLPYVEGQSPRTKVQDKVYTSTEYPPDQDITLHSELSYTAEPPHHLFFHCQIAASVGGETPITDCRVAHASLDPAIRDRFVEKQVCYVKNMHGGRGFGKSWQAHFETEERDEVERYLAEHEIDFEWRGDGSLRTSQVRPAVRPHPSTGETVWANQADLWHSSNLGRKGDALLRTLGEENLPTHAYFGDGSPIDPEDLAAIRSVFWDRATIFRWQPGDVLVLDNLLVAHGRRAFEGERRVLVAMA